MESAEYDFHQYSLLKLRLSAYVDLLRNSDSIRLDIRIHVLFLQYVLCTVNCISCISDFLKNSSTVLCILLYVLYVWFYQVLVFVYCTLYCFLWTVSLISSGFFNSCTLLCTVYGIYVMYCILCTICTVYCMYCMNCTSYCVLHLLHVLYCAALSDRALI